MRQQNYFFLSQECIASSKGSLCFNACILWAILLRNDPIGSASANLRWIDCLICVRVVLGIILLLVARTAALTAAAAYIPPMASQHILTISTIAAKDQLLFRVIIRCTQPCFIVFTRIFEIASAYWHITFTLLHVKHLLRKHDSIRLLYLSPQLEPVPNYIALICCLGILHRGREPWERVRCDCHPDAARATAAKDEERLDDDEVLEKAPAAY